MKRYMERHTELRVRRSRLAGHSGDLQAREIAWQTSKALQIEVKT